MFGSLLVRPIPCPASCFYMEGNMDKVVISWAVGLVQFIVAKHPFDSCHGSRAQGCQVFQVKPRNRDFYVNSFNFKRLATNSVLCLNTTENEQTMSAGWVWPLGHQFITGNQHCWTQNMNVR